MALALRIAAGLALVGPLFGCPQTTAPGPTPVAAKGPPAADDPRVINETGDFYAANPEADPARATPTAPPPATSPGTGRPDETNGKCRLYAPEMPDPGCCERQLGFDVDTVKRACGLKLYLGESFHATCGFYFLTDATATGAAPTWFRLSTVRGATPRESADEHDEYTRKLWRDPEFRSEPIPGLAGAYWSQKEDLHWAFLPGWSTVRQFTWQDGSCSDEGIRQILAALVAAPEIAAGTGRLALIPTANPPRVQIEPEEPASTPTQPAPPSAPATATKPSPATPPG